MNVSSQQITVRFNSALAIAYGLFLLGLIVEWSWLAVITWDIDGFVIFLGLSGLVASIFTATQPFKPPFTAETAAVSVGLLLCIVVASGRVSFWMGSEISFSLIAFLVIVALTFRMAEQLWSMERLPMRNVDDKVLAMSLGGAAATLASLLVLPWYKVSSGRDSESLTFFDWKDLYDEFANEVMSIRLLYLESGFIASIVATLVVVFVVYKGRTSPLKTNPPLRWVLMGTIILMGLWGLFLVLGMNSIDESDGGVQFGAWLLIVGHVLMGFGAWNATAMAQASPETTEPMRA